MDLESILETLQQNLFRRTIFYVPKAIVPESVKEKLKHPIFDEIFDQVVIVLKNGDFKSGDIAPYLLELLEKPKLLSNNIIILLDCQDKLNKGQFNFLIEQYQSQQNFYTNTCKWLFDNFSKYFQNQESFYKTYFEIQANSFLKHQQDLTKHILPNNLNKTVAITENNILDFIPFDKNSVDEKVKKDGYKIRRPKDITDSEIDTMLLQQVFGINDTQF